MCRKPYQVERKLGIPIDRKLKLKLKLIIQTGIIGTKTKHKNKMITHHDANMNSFLLPKYVGLSIVNIANNCKI